MGSREVTFERDFKKGVEAVLLLDPIIAWMYPGNGRFVMRPMKSLVLSVFCLMMVAGSAMGWSTAGPIITTAQNSMDPWVDVDNNGDIHLVWREQVGGSVSQIWYSNDIGGAFQGPMQLSQGGAIHCYEPMMVSDGADTHVVWISDQTGNNFEVWYRRWTSGTWSGIYNASNTPIKSLKPAICARGDIGPLVTFDEAIYAADNYDVFYSEWNGSGFSAASNLSNTPYGAVYGSVASNSVIGPDGVITVCWPDRISGEYHLNVRRRVNGLWQSRQEISTIEMGPGKAGMAVGANGHVAVTYNSLTNIWFQEFDGTGWTSPQMLPATLSGPVRPKVAIDAHGISHVIVDAFTDAQNHRDVFYTNNSQGSWSAWENISQTDGTFSINATIKYDQSASRLLVVWQEDAQVGGGTGPINLWSSIHPVVSGPAGTIAGVVRDPQNHLLSGVEVWTREDLKVTTDANGAYQLYPMAAGTHTVHASKQWYEAATISDVVVTEDTTTTVNITLVPQPPDPVASFSVTEGNRKNTLIWTTPAGDNFSGTMLRYKTTGYPTGPTDGTLLLDLTTAPDTQWSYNHINLTNGVTYYYAAFAHTWNPAYAAGAEALGIPHVRGDFDHDTDIDMEDFGRFQACLSGENQPQSDPACFDARMDTDLDVDQNDATFFRQCLAGPGVVPDPDCASTF